MSEKTKITGIEISGFKSAIKPVRISILNLTILAGQNSAGKSTIMQPIIMCKQTLEKPFDPGSLAIDGPIVQFTSADQFFSRKSTSSTKEFSLKVDQGDDYVKIVYRKGKSGDVYVKSMSFTDKEKVIDWSEGMIINKDSAGVTDELKTITSLFSKGIFPNLPNVNFVVVRNRCALSAKINPTEKLPFNATNSPADRIMSEIKNLIYLPGLRGNPERNYRITTSTKEYPGNFNDYVASIIHNWQATKDPKLTSLGVNLKTLGLTWKVETRKIDDTRAEIVVGRLSTASQGGAYDTVNIADVGFGVSQTLPVLVALLTAIPGQHVFIEQPEIHLHPKAQVALAEVIFGAVERGVRVIVETHSSLLILAFQSLIAENRLHPKQVSMNWFTRDDKGQTIVAQAEIEEDGSYGGWPLDFSTIDLELQERYMNSVDLRHTQEQ